MLSFLFLLGHRLRQPAWLAVLFCCALIGQAAGATGWPGIQTPTIADNTACRAADFSTERLHTIGNKNLAGEQIACPIFKAAWSLGQLQLARRIAERWIAASLVNLAPLPPERSFMARPVLKVLDASSPEYLTLRQLRL